MVLKQDNTVWAMGDNSVVNWSYGNFLYTDPTSK